LWDLPFFRNRSDLQGKVLGGWQYSGVVAIRTGLRHEILDRLHA
jgi:hypothetical protein